MTETPEADASRVQVRVVELEPLLVPVPKAAELLGLSARAVYDLIYAGEIDAVRVGLRKGRHNITYGALQAYVERCREEDRLLHGSVDDRPRPAPEPGRRGRASKRVA
ncbi:helix-turn-helix domain-containing protein [Streptomonospora litoralis]|nr:helix-turn-helix domain-containing protein [Streptomonospora litoralis]